METDRNLHSDRISPQVQIHARRICGEKCHSWMARRNLPPFLETGGWNRGGVLLHGRTLLLHLLVQHDAGKLRLLALVLVAARTTTSACATTTVAIRSHTHQYSGNVQLMMNVGKYQPRVVFLVLRAVCLVSCLLPSATPNNIGLIRRNSIEAGLPRTSSF